MTPRTPIHQQLLDAGVPLDFHESDLYALVTPESRAIVECYEFYRSNVTTFVSEIDQLEWFVIPFEYVPFWERGAADFEARAVNS